MELQKNYSAFQAAGAQVVAVAVASLADVESWCQKSAMPYPVLADERHGVAQAYGVYNQSEGLARPAVFVIGARGEVVWKQMGQAVAEPVAAETVLGNLP